MEIKDYKDIWFKLKEKKLQEYAGFHRLLNQTIKPDSQYHLFQIANAMVGKNEISRLLEQMDLLDGTQEFQKLLNDLEREDNEN